LESWTVKSGAAEPIRDGRDPRQQPDSASRSASGTNICAATPLKRIIDRTQL
jgi:hypothetical protein